MASQVVKIRREALVACMTCPICDKLLRDATTISLCLHTFCRKCIYEKLSDEEVDSCPVCDIDLGCVPVEKLRPDHNLQDIRAKIFPFKRKKINSSEVVPSISPPFKRKERSLSSLVVSAPKVSVQTGTTGKRSKFGARKNAPTPPTSFVKSIKQEVDPSDEFSESSSSDETAVLDKKQATPSGKPLHHQIQKKVENGDKEAAKPTVDLWKPLNFLVEAANRTKPPTSNPLDLHLTNSKPSTSALESEVDGPIFQRKYSPYNEKVEGDEKGKSVMPGLVKRRRRASKWKKYTPQAIVDVLGERLIKRACPIWFSLVPSQDQKGDGSLLQKPACYLRVVDGDLPVSFLQKYLVKKLNLTSEAEVDIYCHGQPVLPTLRLRTLVDLWLLESRTKKILTSVGSSAEEFVMALSYSKKTTPEDPGK